MGAPDHWRVLEFVCALLQDVTQFAHSGGDDLGSIPDLKGLSGVHDIIRRQAIMKPPGNFRVADFFRYRGSKSDHVMLYFRLYLLDPLQFEVSILQQLVCGGFRDKTAFSQCLRGCQLHREPHAVLVLITPYAAHLWAGISRDQVVSSSVNGTLDCNCHVPAYANKCFSHLRPENL